MRINNYIFPNSSFLSIEKDLVILTNEFFKNDRLQKLLYYDTPDALSRNNLNNDQKAELFKKNIKIVPKLYIDKEALSYIIISFDNFTTNPENPEFRDNIISFDIICHFDQWQLKDSFQLRPYRIAAEIDTILNNKRLTGIGKTEFLGANQLILNDEYAGVSLMYAAIHGDEDKKGQVNPQNDAKFEEEFNKIFNQ